LSRRLTGALHKKATFHQRELASDFNPFTCGMIAFDDHIVELFRERLIGEKTGMA
jgi:hypothetical protein